MMKTVELLVCSFGASFGLGIVFRMEKKYLALAGLGGMLTRIVYLILLTFTENAFIYSFFAAMAASLFAEFLAGLTKKPSTVFLYPSLIPMIPGRLIYETAVGLLRQDAEATAEYGIQCILALAGLGLGFAVITMVLYYQRNYLHLEAVKDLAKEVLPIEIVHEENKEDGE